MPWLSWQPALILPLLFYCAAPPSPSRSLVIAAPPSSLASSYLLSRTPPHPRPSPPSHSLMHSETRTQTGAQPVTHAPGIYARMPIIPLARPRDSLTLSHASLFISSSVVSIPGSFLLILELSELEYSDSACISGTPTIPLCALILIYAFFLYALPSRLPLVCVFFFLPSL